MRNEWIGSSLFLISYPGVILVASALHLRGLMDVWFIPVLALAALAFSHFLSCCWPSSDFAEPRGEIFRHLPFAAFALAVNYAVARPLMFMLAWWVAGLLPVLPGLVINSQPSWLLIVGCLIFYEAVGYGYHRWAHRNPFLWRWVHSPHHEPSSFGSFLALRVHYLEYFLMQMTRLCVLHTLQVQQSVILVVVAVSLWASIMVHTRTRLTFGWGNYFVVTPQTHVWHHDLDLRVNYGFGVLAIFDQLGGTFCYRRGQRPAGVGIRGALQRTLLHLVACRPLRLGQGVPGPASEPVPK